MSRKLIVLLGLLAVLTMFAMPIHANANPIEQERGYIPIMPFWEHFTDIYVSLDIVNGRALMSGTAFAQTGTEWISVDAVLVRVNSDDSTTQIGAWRNLRADGAIWGWERPHMVARRHYYRLTLTMTAFRNGRRETVSLSHTSWAN